MHTFITFLGRKPRTEFSYQETVYYFSDDTDTGPVSFIGWALKSRIKPNPDQMIIVGTRSSMWDHLFENLESEIDPELYQRFSRQIEAGNVEAPTLAKLEIQFKSQIKIPCHFVLVPRGEEIQEQITILKRIEAKIPEGAAVSLDVTHGFHHMPMFSLIIAQYLQRVKEVSIRNLFYASYDPDRGEGEVHNLIQLFGMNNWMTSLEAFEASGDWSLFVKPLKDDVVNRPQISHMNPAIKAMDLAGFYERVFLLSEAHESLQLFKDALPEKFLGSADLFTDDLTQYLDMIQGAESIDCVTLAQFYLENNNYIRATIFAIEAVFMELATRKEDIRDYQTRLDIEKSFADGERGTPRLYTAYTKLTLIRDTLANGGVPRFARIKKMLAHPSKMKQHVQQLFYTLFPDFYA